MIASIGLDESGKIIRNLAYEQYTMISLADSNQTANEEEMEKKERILFIRKIPDNFTRLIKTFPYIKLTDISIINLEINLRTFKGHI